MQKDLNKTMLTGHLGANPMTRPAGESKVTTFNIAVAAMSSAKNPTPEPLWMPCEAWDKLGDICAGLLEQGTKVLVEGRLVSSSWKTDAGEQKSKIVVRLSDMIILSSKKRTEEDQAAGSADVRPAATTSAKPSATLPTPQGIGDEDLPF